MSGTWRQTADNHTSYTDATASALNSDGTWTTAGTATSSGNGSSLSGYTGAGSYVVSTGTAGGPTVSGGGTTAESGSDGSTYGYTSNSALLGGAWQAAGGSGQGSGSGFTHSSYTATGAYSRPLDSGSLQGTWRQSGNADSSYTDQTASTQNAAGTWTTTGSENDAGSGGAAASYSGSGSTSRSSTNGNSGNGGDSSFASQGGESLTQNGSYLYTAASALASDGSVTSTSTASAFGSASGADAYSAAGATDDWANSGGNGYSSHSEAHDSWGLSVKESQQGQWQQAYKTVSGPAASVTTGSASASGQASGDATYYHNGSGSSSQTVSTGSMSGMGMGSGSGTAVTAGSSWSSGVSGQDHYNDQATSSQTAKADGTWASVTTALNTVWGSGTSQGTNTGLASLSGVGTATVGGLGGSTPTSYSIAVTAFGFYGGAGFRATAGGAELILPPLSGAPASLIGPAAKVAAPVVGLLWTTLTAGVVPVADFVFNAAIGWAEANLFGLVPVGLPSTAAGQAGRVVGNGIAYVQGIVEMVVGAVGVAGGGGFTLVTLGAGGEIGVPVAAGGVVALAHGYAVCVGAFVSIARNRAAYMSAAPGGGAAGNPAPTREALIGELAQNGVKNTPENIVGIAKDAKGKVVFLEKGNANAGLQHIVEQHGADFARRGIPEAQIPDAVIEAAAHGKQVGMQGTRPIFEVEFGGKIQKIAVTKGDNGFIVGANPAGP